MPGSSLMASARRRCVPPLHSLSLLHVYPPEFVLMLPLKNTVAYLYQRYEKLDITPQIHQVVTKPSGFGAYADVYIGMWMEPQQAIPR